MIERIRYGGVNNPYNYSEFVCDTVVDLADLPTTVSVDKYKKFDTCSIGSKATVISNKTTYILNSNNQWIMLNDYKTSGGSIVVDETLTESGQAADSKVVGDKFLLLENWKTTQNDYINNINIKISSIESNSVGQKTDDGGEIFNDYENNIATTNSHAEGSGTKAYGKNSHAEGYRTIASSENQHVQGKFNVEDSESKYAFIIGNGDGDSNRSNAIAIDWDGLFYLNNSDAGIDLSEISGNVTKLINDSSRHVHTNMQALMEITDADITALHSTFPQKIYEIEQSLSDYATKEEVTQARVDANGTTYSTLKERLDSTDENVESVSTELKSDLGELESDLGLTIPHNLFNKDYAEDGYDYNGGFLEKIAVDISTGEIKPDGTRYVSYPIRIYQDSSIYFVGSNSQRTLSIVGFLQYDSSGNFVEFVNISKIENTNVKNGYIRIISGAAPVAYLRVCYSEYINETYSPYFNPYYSKLRDIDENKSTIVEISSRVTELEEKFDDNGITLVDCEYESGLFNGGGKNAETDYESIRVAESISTNEDEMLFIYIKAGYVLVINDTGLDGTQKNLVFSNHLSYSTNGRSIRVGAYRSDKSQILDSFSEIIKVYKFKPKNAHELYDICIASSDSEKIYKDRADIICDGANDQFLIQCSIFNYRRTNKVLLYPGNYNITEIRDNPYSEDGLYGHKVVFSTQNPEAVRATNTIHIDGYMRHIIQQESIGAVNIRFTDECWNGIDENGEQISVIGGEYRSFYQRRFALHMSCLNFWGNDAKKPVVFVDGYYAANMQIEKVNVMSEKTTFGAYTYIPNELHNGFRGMQGSPYGTNYIKNSLAWKCGIGYNIGGEHFVLEDAGACFCGIGFAFSHYYGRINMQHNNIMIKCVVSQCMRSIILDRYGLQEDSEDKLKNTKQMLECIGLQLESSFTTEGLSDYGYSDGTHNTEGVYEVHNGTWYGTITLQTIAKAVAKGCNNIRVTIVMLPTAGTLSERPSISKVANYTEFYDVENNKKYIAYDGEWRQLN